MSNLRSPTTSWTLSGVGDLSWSSSTARSCATRLKLGTFVMPVPPPGSIRGDSSNCNGSSSMLSRSGGGARSTTGYELVSPRPPPGGEPCAGVPATTSSSSSRSSSSSSISAHARIRSSSPPPPPVWSTCRPRLRRRRTALATPTRGRTTSISSRSPSRRERRRLPAPTIAATRSAPPPPSRERPPRARARGWARSDRPRPLGGSPRGDPGTGRYPPACPRLCTRWSRISWRT
mmetsp:Transcript_12136/g.51056  ORF Transcript_12136/g.51056 Transcript_12136/m.51056 type:complete len:233 (-) Transcript_12136:353-1051(-)